MSMKKIISKNEYSEWVLRKSLYWMSTVARWRLDGDEEHWLVSFTHWNDEVEFELERLLNDYKLREKLQAHTVPHQAVVNIADALHTIPKPTVHQAPQTHPVQEIFRRRLPPLSVHFALMKQIAQPQQTQQEPQVPIEQVAG